MNSASKHAVSALLGLFLAGCAPKNAKTAPPAQAQAPAITAGKAGAMYPPPLTESQTQTEPAPAPAPVVAKAEPAPEPPPPPPATTKKTSHKPKPSAAKPAGTESGSTQTAGSEAAASGTAAPASETTDVAANSEPAAASPIGELTPADTPEQARKGKDTGDLINQDRRWAELHQTPAQHSGAGNGQSDQSVSHQGKNRPQQSGLRRRLHPRH